MTRLPPAPDIEWRDGAPYARAFDDIYFSRNGGLAETEAVFHAGCDLPNAWARAQRFAILELGFGTGLNALATQRLWARTRAPGARLDYVAIEAFPLAQADAARALAAFPEIDARALLAHWPVRAYAPQRIALGAGMTLTVLHGQAGALLAQIAGRFDAFFLDGFAPARNDAMWSEEIARRIAALAKPGARLASYSVAGAVRRALGAAGFAAAKRPGFAGKRERLEAHFAAGDASVETAPARVAVVGGGIAGAALAHALTARGARVAIYEAGAALGAGASGNAAGLVMPRLDRGRTPAQEMFLAAYLHAVAAYEAIGVLDACGVVEAGREDLHADPPLPEEWLELRADNAVRHAPGGVVRPLDAIAAWTALSEVRLNARVVRLERHDSEWRLIAGDGRILGVADAVVIANGAGLGDFAQTDWLTLHRTAGQIEHGPLEGAPLADALVDETYAAPFDGGVVFGATFDRNAEPVVSAEARARNLAALAKLAPDVAARVHHDALSSRAGIRAAASDYLPIAGRAPDAQAWLEKSVPNAGNHPGLYLLGALGSRGLTLAPLLADRIASEMFFEPQALQRASLDAVSPARLLHRMLKKGLTKPASVKDDGEN